MNGCCNKKCTCLYLLGILGILILIIFLLIKTATYSFSFSFSKVDSTNNNPLDGAIFELTQNGELIANAVSENGGIVTFSNLKPGEYVLTEIEAPDGYIKDSNSYRITVSNNGAVTYNDGLPISDLKIENTPDITNYTIIYKSNSEPPSPPVIDLVSANSSYQIKDNSFSYDGYVFKYWNTEPDGSGTTYNPGDVITVTSNLTLYAIYEKLEPSQPPTINTVMENAPLVRGTGIPGATITVQFPNGIKTSTTVNATSVAPCIRHPYLDATQSNHPIRLGRPVVAPNSPPSPPRLLSSSASSPKISLTKAPAPTALEYALHTVTICLISYGGIPAPIAP